MADPVTPVTLQDRNSTAAIDVNSSMGMYQWTVNDINMLNQQWFWYRAGGMSGQQAINTISTANYSTSRGLGASTDNVLTLNYNNSQYGVQIVYELSGGTVGDADILESITLFNHTGSALEFHFFQYSDFNLAGSPLGDTVAVDAASGGGYNRAQQWKLTSQISETITSPSATRCEAGDVPTVLNNINGGTYDLNNTQNFGPDGDASWALQWDFVIGANSFVDVTKDKRLSVTPVPEPTALGLLGLGFAAWVLRRKQ